MAVTCPRCEGVWSPYPQFCSPMREMAGDGQNESYGMCKKPPLQGD